MQQLYTATTDPMFQKPYIDIDEWREGAVHFHYVHGGFEGTDTRFSFYFPRKEDYAGRFFHFMAPAQGSEDAAMRAYGEDSKIAFALTHGAYFVETNMGVAPFAGPLPDATIIYRASAACAEYSRRVAADLFGPHRPYGYLYGGSGGAFKTISCMENTDAWDGSVPYVSGTPMSIPNSFTVRAHAKRILRHKLAGIADALEPGGGDVYAGLNQEEREALDEVTAMGFPPYDWFMHEYLDDGALPILAPLVTAMDPTYFEDFWTLPGYLGADPAGSAVRDRIRLNTTVTQVYVPGRSRMVDDAGNTGVDQAWQRGRGDKGADERAWVELASAPTGDVYIYGAMLQVRSGPAAGFKAPLEAIEGSRVIFSPGFGLQDMLDQLALLQPGDEVSVDNSDYIAIQTYHRHQLPDESYAGWAQFRNADGSPKYPQRGVLTGPMVAHGGAGSTQSGAFTGKMILVAALMDESAFPWQADWYRGRVRQLLGADEAQRFRIWYVDHAIHGDLAAMPGERHLVPYLGALHQALLDVSDWVERGIQPAASTSYTVENAQMLPPASAKERGGIQPVVRLNANGGECATVKAGESVFFSAEVDLPTGTGRLTAAEWSFDGLEREASLFPQDIFPVKGLFIDTNEDGTAATVQASYTFTRPGVFFPVLRVSSQRQGDAGKVFTQVKNLCRVRVVVE